MDPRAARALGIAAIYQQPALFAHLTVAENIALALEQGGPWRRVDWKARHRRAAELLERMGAEIDSGRLVKSLSMPEQQLVEIAKAIGADAKILIMDEPTASLTEREVERLFGAIGVLRGEGAGIIYISHRLEEVFAIADRVTVLRDGETVATRPVDRIDRTELVRYMVGQDAAASSGFSRTSASRVSWTSSSSNGAVALEARRLRNRATGLRDISLTVRSGEILGLAGLVGSGRTELAETLFGLTPPDSGEVLIRGIPVHVDSPAGAIALGIGYVPEDRRKHGVVMGMSIAANTTLANLKAVSRAGLIDSSAELRDARRYADRLRIKAPSVLADVESLSGGNQQKVALARWLSIDPSVLILDEPTQGVDVGSKAEIHELIEHLAESGVAILVISSELPEVLRLCDRIIVMRTGTISGTLQREEATQQKVLALALETAD
jgi:rhamnose transport system ATP-binding protein